MKIQPQKRTRDLCSLERKISHSHIYQPVFLPETSGQVGWTGVSQTQDWSQSEQEMRSTVCAKCAYQRAGMKMFIFLGNVFSGNVPGIFVKKKA